MLVKWVAEKVGEKGGRYSGRSSAETHKLTLAEVRKILSDAALKGEIDWGDQFRVTLFTDKILDAWTIIVRGVAIDNEDHLYVVGRCGAIRGFVYKKEGNQYYRLTYRRGWETPIDKIKEEVEAFFDDYDSLVKYLIKTKRDTDLDILNALNGRHSLTYSESIRRD